MDNAVNQKSRLFGFLILLSIFLPMALAYIMFKTGWGVSGDTTNKGQLLRPALAIADLALNNGSEELKTLYPANKKKWRILVPVTTGCNKDCQNNLYITRQVHIRLAEKAYRVERILLLLDNLLSDQVKGLEKEHPNSLMVQSSKKNLQQWLNQTENKPPVEDSYYLIDQEGYAMMRYSAQNTGHDLLDDIKKLLKYTYEN
jgi:cytochrome oxidase Cu insertion factor (SCO1/SenC/PrrC family)